uniref:Uncharacterized protein n=1 Tax=Rhizophora mucronata TaxID=61149 RepID=A0A2P2MAR5_RHIMU
MLNMRINLKEMHEAVLHDHCSYPVMREVSLLLSQLPYPPLQLPQKHLP